MCVFHTETWALFDICGVTKASECTLVGTVLLNEGDDVSFLELTELNRASFYELHNILFADEQPQQRGRGRPKTLNSFSELGLLHYLNSTIKVSHFAKSSAPCLRITVPYYTTVCIHIHSMIVKDQK